MKAEDTVTDPHAPADALYRVRLTDIFEGPMDLLVHLIRKNEINIYDIPIAIVTEQYLQYLEWLDAMNVEYAAEFVVMAATLAHIKSRMLLPLHAEEDEEEDPRQQIVRPLLEYLKIKSAAAQLSERPLLGEDTFTRAGFPGGRSRCDDDEVIKIGLFELIDAFQKVLSGLSAEARIESHLRNHLGQGAHHADRGPTGGQGVAHLLRAVQRAPDARGDRGHLPGHPGNGEAGADPAGAARELRDHQDILPVMDDLKNIVETLLFVAEEPLSAERLKKLLVQAEVAEIRAALESLQADYEARGGGFYLAEVAGGFQFRTRPEYNGWVRRLVDPKPVRLSKAALETLAIIAYKQPIIRADVEHIRGVDCGGVLRQLLERKLVRVLGRRGDPGPAADLRHHPEIPRDLRPQGPEGPAHTEGNRGVRQGPARRHRQRRDRAGRVRRVAGRRRRARRARWAGVARGGCLHGPRRSRRHPRMRMRPSPPPVPRLPPRHRRSQKKNLIWTPEPRKRTPTRGACAAMFSGA